VDENEDVEDLDPTVSLLVHAKKSAKAIDKDKRRGGDEVVNSGTAQYKTLLVEFGVGGEIVKELR
jgi:hypothetical protein